MLDGNCRVAKDAAKSAECDLGVKWDSDGNPLRVACVSKAYVAAFLSDGDIAKLP